MSSANMSICVWTFKGKSLTNNTKQGQIQEFLTGGVPNSGSERTVGHF